MKTKTKLFVTSCATAMLLGAVSASAIDLLEKYPTTLTAGDAKPENARAWDFNSGDVYHLSKFSLEAGQDLKIETGAAHVGIAHCQDGAVWAVVIPSHGGKMASTAAKEPEEILHVWLRFHPKEISRVFPPDTVSEGGTTDLMQQMRDVAAVKFRSSWHAGMRAMIPEPKDMTVDADTKAGPRRFFMVNTEKATAQYVSAFEDQTVQPANASLETAPPVVVKTVPVAGATAVDPALTEIRITYSKPMLDGSWSWSTWGPENYPETTGSSKYLEDARTCVLPVKLQANKFYAIWLNSDKFKNFKAADGRPAVPYLLTFSTGDAQTGRLRSDLTAAEGVGAVVAQKIKQEVTRRLKELGASVNDVLVTVAEARDSATPFKVTYRGLQDFKSSSGVIVSPPDGEFIMNYIGGGQWQGALAGVTFTAQVGTVDKIDLPFINDPRVLGRWETVDFVPRPSDFHPDKRTWRGGAFSIRGLDFLENGKFPEGWRTWTKDFVIHHGDKTASHYEIREIKGQSYMFVEWKSGDVTIMGRKPSYCVLQKATGSASSLRSESVVERTVNKLVSEFPSTEDLSTPESACAAWQRANSTKDVQTICKLSLTPLDPKEQQAWFDRGQERDAEGMAIYLKALAESKIVVVQIYRGELASVITYLPFPEGKGRSPYSARFFGPVNGAWKNLGEDRLTDLESAKANFESKKERMWRRYNEQKAKTGSSNDAQNTSKTTDTSLALLNDDQRAVVAWTDRQFRSFFDSRSFDGWSDNERTELETRLIDTLSGPQTPEYYEAINTLCAMRSTKALPKLRQIASERVDRNNRDRWMAIRALGIMGDKASVPELIHLVYHGNQNTHWWAQISLVRLTGQNFGKDWNAWGKWWNEQKGEPPYKPEIIRWWNGQAEPDKLAASLEESDAKFLSEIKGQAAAKSEQSGDAYLQQQLKLAGEGNYWAKFRLWECYAKGARNVAKNSAEADKWLAELIKGTCLAKFEPVNGFNPQNAGEMLADFSAHSSLRSGRDKLGGASFFRTTKVNGKLIGSFLTDVPDEFKKAVEQNPNLKLISIEPVTTEKFLAHESSAQESL